MIKRHKSIRKKFEKKWCKTKGSGLLSSLCHIDDVNELLDKVLEVEKKRIVKEIYNEFRKNFGVAYWGKLKITIERRKYEQTK